MKKSLSLLFSLYGSCLLAGCGAGNSTSPPPITVSLSPNSALALDVNQSVSITANVTNDTGNQGFDWAPTCGGGNCGTITAHTTSGAPATFTAPGAPPSGPVTITARLTGQTNSITTTAAISPPPTVAMTGAITAAIALQVSRPALSSLLNGKADLSGDMALRIEKAFGVKMDTLMRMQSSYDIAQTRKREKKIRVRRFHQLLTARS